jgi:uncharacterized protein (TIGR02757 family)
METMDNAPFEYISHSNKKDWKAFYEFAHRTFNGIDAIYFIQSLQHVYKNGGLEKAFTANGDMQHKLEQFRSLFLGEYPAGRTAKYIADVTKNASAKRLNMFLLWMVRNDRRGVDFGIWKSISAVEIYCPINLHSGRVARKLSLLVRTQNDWKAVDELTQNLRQLDPEYPTKYDFALFGLGVFEKF